MQQKIINIGLIVLSCSFLFKFGTQTHQIAMASMISLGICLFSLYQGKLRLSNKSVLAFLVYILFATWQAAKPTIAFCGVALPHFSWLPITMVVLYCLTYSSIEKESIKCLPVIVWIGFIASCYCLLQYLGIDTPIVPTERVDLAYIPSNNVVAWFGHPVYAGCSIAMIIPLAIKLKKWFMIPLFVLAVLATKSDMAIGSMVCSLVAIPFLKNKKALMIGICLLCVILGLFYINKDKIKVNDNGRFQMWSTMIEDIKKPVEFTRKDGTKYIKRFGLFGKGIGSFKYIYHDNHPSGRYYTWLNPHNEYLMVFYELGAVGLIFVLYILGVNLLNIKDVYIKASLICVCLSALGIYVWELGFTQFMTVYLLGLNKKE